jgi:hypothetical protein
MAPSVQELTPMMRMGAGTLPNLFETNVILVCSREIVVYTPTSKTINMLMIRFAVVFYFSTILNST